MPRTTVRFSTRLPASTIITDGWSPWMIALAGTSNALFFSSRLKITSAYMPGVSERSGFFTSTSVNIVLVEFDTSRAKRTTVPGNCCPVACTWTETTDPTWTNGTSRSGTGMRSRNTSLCASRTTA
jgi:hypothetical protein